MSLTLKKTDTPIAYGEQDDLKTIIFCDKNIIFEDGHDAKDDIKTLSGVFHILPPQLFNTEQMRFTGLIVGQPGSGKSYMSKVLIRDYLYFHPKNKIYVMNPNPDEKYDFLTHRMKFSDLLDQLKRCVMKDCLLLIDDILSEDYEKEEQKIIHDIIKNILLVQRKNRISLLLTSHCFYGIVNDKVMKTVIGNIDFIIIFREYNLMQYERTIKNFYSNRSQILKDTDILLKKSRWICVNRRPFEFVISNDTIKLY